MFQKHTTTIYYHQFNSNNFQIQNQWHCNTETITVLSRELNLYDWIDNIIMLSIWCFFLENTKLQSIPFLIRKKQLNRVGM